MSEKTELRNHASRKFARSTTSQEGDSHATNIQSTSVLSCFKKTNNGQAFNIQTPVRIIGQVQHYPWGGVGPDALIPNLLKQAPGDQAWAELWFGLHRKAPAYTARGLDLSECYAESDIPWLLKVLDAKQMLSVQVHPNQSQASAGFSAEIASQVELNRRNYNDPNPKPEIAIPLTKMWLMVGFLPQTELVSRFKRYSAIYRAFQPVIDAIDAAQANAEVEVLIQSLYEQVYQLSQNQIQAITESLLGEIVKQSKMIEVHGALKGAIHSYHKGQIEYWVLASQEKYPNDVGVFSFFMLNLVQLTPYGQLGASSANNDALVCKPGEAIFTPAGVPHFYLEGACIEHMANSDNVLRAGFTHKHKDIDALLGVISYADAPIASQIVKPELVKSGHSVVRRRYVRADNHYFMTEVISHLEANTVMTEKARAKPTIGFVLAGELLVSWPGGEEIILGAGEAFLVPPMVQCGQYSISSTQPNTEYALAYTPA